MRPFLFLFCCGFRGSIGIEATDAALLFIGEATPPPIADMAVAGVAGTPESEPGVIGVLPLLGPLIPGAPEIEYIDDRAEDMVDGGREEAADPVMEKLLGQIIEKRDLPPPSS